MWLDIFSDGRVYEMEGEKVIKLYDTIGEVQKLLEILDNTEAGTFAIAPEEKLHPTVIDIPSERSFIRITKSAQLTDDDLALLRVSLVKGNAIQEEVEAVSGLQEHQNFRIGRMSRSRSHEPLPEGKWEIGRLEWAGAEGDLDAKFSNLSEDIQQAIGPVWSALTYKSEGGTEREAIGFHLDANADRGFPGTDGCVGIRDEKNLAKFVKWFSDPRSAPKLAVVDWGLGTV